MDFSEKRQFAARRADLDAVRNFVESACPNLAHADLQRLVLIVEELFSNSIEHGYGCDSDAPVWLALAPTAGGCGIIYEDAAQAHDPFAAPNNPMLEAAAENRPVGGLGVYLIRQICSSRRYERRDGHNVIELFVSSSAPGA